MPPIPTLKELREKLKELKKERDKKAPKSTYTKEDFQREVEKKQKEKNSGQGTS